MPLDEPPRDATTNEVVPHDHHQILDDHHVIRRISPLHLIDDEKAPTGRRVSSIAFQASTGANGGMSVDIEEAIAAAGEDPRKFVLQPPFIGAVRFEVGKLRELSFKVGYDPIWPTNPYHGEVWGAFSGSLKKKLSRLAEAYIDPLPPAVAPDAEG